MKKKEIIDPKGLKLVKEMKKHARKYWGKKCKDYQYGCSVCDIYLALNILETIFI